ncbi:MAG TPA: ABC transporter permease subunit [Planctomycetota bacterium]|nr:ABC transporter permease subunit [Planctomycetota bacterium]
MRAYIIRRFLLMIPTLFGVTLVTFLVMQLAPGDPLKMQLSQAGSQGESGATREAFLHQRRQWKLDKPALLNIRWFRDFSTQARFCALIYGLTGEDLKGRLDELAANPSPGAFDDLKDFLRGLGIEAFDAQLADPDRRKDLADRVKKGVQVRVEETLAEHGVKYFAALLEDGDLRIRIGAIRCLTLCTLGDPFLYTYSKDPLPEETEGIVTTWRIWWDREREKFKPVPPDRLKEVQDRFRTLVAEPSRGKILEGMPGFARNDAPFLMEVLLGETPIKEKYVASIALRSWIGRPLKVDVKLTDGEAAVAPVAANWKAYVAIHASKYDPSLARKSVSFLADTQYANSLKKLATFDFGRSMVKPYDPVGPKIWSAAKVSAPIMLLSEVFVYLFAVPFGVYCAVKRGKWQDRLISLQLFIFNSIPSVVLGMMLLTFFCFGVFLKLFPMYGLHSEGYEAFPFYKQVLDYVSHVTLPLVCYSLSSLASLAMFGRSSMLDVVNQDYIRTARAKGLSERTVILKHALRNALIPVITLFSSFIPALLGGSVIIEYLFGINGMGRLSYDSIQAKDYNTVMAIIYLDAIIVMLSILLSDLLYVLVDPRISFSKSEGGA